MIAIYRTIQGPAQLPMTYLHLSAASWSSSIPSHSASTFTTFTSIWSYRSDTKPGSSQSSTYFLRPSLSAESHTTYVRSFILITWKMAELSSTTRRQSITYRGSCWLESLLCIPRSLLASSSWLLSCNLPSYSQVTSSWRKRLSASWSTESCSPLKVFSKLTITTGRWLT